MASVLVGTELILTCAYDVTWPVSLAFLAVFSDGGGGAFLSLLHVRARAGGCDFHRPRGPALSHPSVSPWAEAVVINLGFIFRLLSFHVAL